MELLQIVPELPPKISGLGDYAALLAAELQSAFGVKSRFIVGDPAWQGGTLDAKIVRRRTATELAALLPAADAEPATLLLHYVGYGYAPRGCPFWLVDALEDWKRRTPRHRLIVIFHETFATGSVWSSAFWTSSLQKSLVKRLARLADTCRMTTTAAASQLRAMLGSKGPPLEVVPVFSNLGESIVPQRAEDRRRQMIIFGNRSWRAAAYAQHAAELAESCRNLEIDRIVDVGAPCGVPFSTTVPVEEMGPLSAAEAAALFAGSLAGYFTYPVPYLAKSGIFAAYCAHGMLPVTFSGNRAPNLDGLLPGKHFLAGTAEGSPEKVSTAAHQWYGAHRLAVHAQGIYQQMQITA